MNQSEIVEELKNLSSGEILGYAIASEEDAKRFYLELAKGKGELISNFFEMLAVSEEAHKNILLKLHEKLFGNADYKTPQDIPFSESTIKIETLGNLVEALKTAMANERNAYRVYKMLAEKQPDYREIFEYLAMQEKAHLEALKVHKDYMETKIEDHPELRTVPLEARISLDVDVYDRREVMY